MSTDDKEHPPNDCPPGLDPALIKLFSGGDDNWRPLTLPCKHYTNVFVMNRLEGKLLLGYKKRGFGKDMWNGFGGKIEPGETAIQAAARELMEECGLVGNLVECGDLLFVNAKADTCMYVHMFRALYYEGDLIESEEMRPRWFQIPEMSNDTTALVATIDFDVWERLPHIPYDDMWPDDRLWIRMLLSNQKFIGRVDFNIENDEQKKGSWKMERFWFGTFEINRDLNYKVHIPPNLPSDVMVS